MANKKVVEIGSLKNAKERVTGHSTDTTFEDAKEKVEEYVAEDNTKIESLNGQKEKTPQEIRREFEEKIVAMSPSELVTFLRDKHRSDVYLVIRDILIPQQIKDIKSSPSYKEFMQIKTEAKQSWDYDHKGAMMLDVDKACTNLYGMVMRVFKANIDSWNDELMLIHNAIDEIREHVGLPKFGWDKPENETNQIPEIKQETDK